MLRAPGEETRAACERAIEIARAVGARAFEGHALNSLGVTRFGSGDFAGGERAAARGQGHRRGGLRPRRHLAGLHEPQRVPRRAGAARGGGRARARGRDQRRPPGHADVRALPAGRGVLATDPPGPPRRDGGHRRARPRPGAQGRGRGRRCTTTPPTSPCAAGAWTARPSTSSWRASCSAARATRCGSATRPPDGPRPRSGRPIPSTPGRSPPARWTSSPRTSTPTTRRACTRPPCAPPPIAPSWRSRLGDGTRAAEAQRDARAIFESLRALLAPERWHDGVPGPEPAAFDALSIAELSRAEGRA